MPPKPQKAQSEFVAFVIEKMSFVHELRVRGMFGGYGIFQDDCMFALIIEDQLYFKADAITRSEFEAKGLNPFTYAARGKLVEVQYFEAPPEVFDEIDEMQSWTHKALTVALKAKKSK
jgi:DNA transformation protein